MDRRTFIGTVASGLLAAPLAVEPQSVGKVWRIAYLGKAVASVAGGSGDGVNAKHWCITCSCGWERECSSEWAAQSVACCTRSRACPR